MKILLASRNAKKLIELRRILAETAPGIELVGLDDVPAFPDTPETELSFAGNALLKARDGVRNSGLPTMADDSGLTVDALNGMPGVLSARWSGKHGDDAANLDLMLAQIADVPDEHRGGAFVCAAAYVHPDGTELVSMGEMRGHVVRERRGTGGFGYDPVFVPEGHELTTAELTPEEKDALSHRGRAFRDLTARIVPS
ncbi:RdgB/HAM1 family non-canonical purine NTP pyrophosphatase [Phytomonospora endophytica]|uniref:dITP/XTP pyrophosphatase n=1 Tax=Phytomonospora endophytica TaxID=714109 RepID=A0A841F7Q2_9ACTN|nr:RdgB/HAM1 family non-canonical purine NTP pyrophosphatase [Phytomonospora endophytica]MBB6033071.1 XTP/dITP diphosphohydrolase [Phytomonospora endophytica]GIG65298.1 non-canonical purine NTP pyrophosphatase [Phytomonospora endophytica]